MLKINDLEIGEELDSKAMRAVCGGLSYMYQYQPPSQPLKFDMYADANKPIKREPLPPSPFMQEWPKNVV